MKLKSLIVAFALLLATPLAASAATITASTGSSATYTSGILKSSETDTTKTNGNQTQLAISGSLVTACTSNCAGDSGTLSITKTYTNFSTNDTVKSSFVGKQSSYSTSCFASIETSF
jgi:hypothetical protein